MLITQTKPTHRNPQFNKGHRSAYRRILVSMILVLSLLCLPSLGTCEMAAMTDDELAAITGHGFSEFTLTNVNGVDIARIDLNLQAATYATMDSLKLGYWDNTGAGNLGWDQDWTGVSLGTTDQDLVLTQFFLQAEFTDINDSSIRQLKTIEVGFQQAYGSLTADFASLSQGTTSREAAGTATYTFEGQPLVLRIHVDGNTPGISFDFGGATRTP